MSDVLRCPKIFRPTLLSVDASLNQLDRALDVHVDLYQRPRVLYCGSFLEGASMLTVPPHFIVIFAYYVMNLKMFQAQFRHGHGESRLILFHNALRWPLKVLARLQSDPGVRRPRTFRGHLRAL